VRQLYSWLRDQEIKVPVVGGGEKMVHFGGPSGAMCEVKFRVDVTKRTPMGVLGGEQTLQEDFSPLLFRFAR